VATCLALGTPATSLATTAAAISAGNHHTCAVTSVGAARCWGGNAFGELGDGTTTSTTKPVQVSGLSSGLTAITAGGIHTCALTSAGAVKCWGDNASGQLGDGTETLRTTPVEVVGLTGGVSAISAGEDHTCALTSAGGVKCWGTNANGELGDGTTEHKTTPVDVSGLTSGVAAISSGNSHTCALTNAGGVKCWGYNGDGQLGDGTETNKTTPVQVSGLTSGATAISAGGESGGGNRTCALMSGGGVKCWGGNSSGQLGDGTTSRRTTPVDVSGLTSVTAISAGGDHTCALTSAGGVRCWGNNYLGQLADGMDAGPESCEPFGSSSCSRTSVGAVGLTSGVTAISARAWDTCALVSGGGVKCWGYNGSGQLGDGTGTGPQKCHELPCSTAPANVWGIAIVACATSTGTVKLSPGVSATPAVQTMKIKGTLAGCTGEPFTESHYTAALKTAGPVSCAVLTAAGEAANGVAKYKWTPNAKHSRGNGSLSLLLTETAGAAWSGELVSGSYAPRRFFGTVSESYAGAATCNTRSVKSGAFNGSGVTSE
jgi:alpha-tubulin suppressor-like RCC1 family protein